jgi:hypothetical protein
MIIVTPIYWLLTADATKELVIGALAQVVSIGLGLCLGCYAFLYAAWMLGLI